MSVSSKVDICNLALDHLNQAGMAANSDIETGTSRNEQLFGRHFDQARQALLRDHTWNFARKRVSIAADGSTPIGYTTQYQLPNDYLRILKVGALDTNGSFSESQDYEIEKGYILHSPNTTGSQLTIYYIYDVTDVSKFDHLFIDLLSLTLAKRLKGNFALSATKQQILMASHSEAEDRAKSVNGQENQPRRRQQSKLLASRRQYGGHFSDGTLRNEF